MQEVRLHSASAFLTLTYDDKNLPDGSTLVIPHLQKFMKRLRKRRPMGLRFFACGEYGGTTERPHYHVLLLNTSFPDMRLAIDGKNPLHVSAELSRIWKLGLHTIGEVNAETAGYCTGYVTTKVRGEHAAAFYNGREPEFAVMSRNPGLGRAYYDKYKDEMYAPQNENIIIGGKPAAIPAYYHNLHKNVDAARVEALKRKIRQITKWRNFKDNTPDRRRVRQEYAVRKAQFFAKRKV